MIVRAVSTVDEPRWAQMRAALWPDADADELAAESCVGALDPTESAVFVAEADDGSLAGFIEIEMRSYVEGPCAPGPYVEAVWVDPDHRRAGVARLLLAAAEEWARARGHSHLGSDALLDNDISHAWHRAAGFAEIERVVIFGKSLG